LFENSKHEEEHITSRNLVLLGLGSVDDGDELLSNEGGTTDEETIDVGLGSKLVSSSRSDGTTIDHTDGLRNLVGLSVDVLAEPVTGPDVGLLSLIGSGGLASADSPNRLVGNDNTSPVLGLLDASSKSSHLGGDDVLSLVLLTLGKKLTNAEDDVETVLKSSGGLVGEKLVGLAKDVTTLAVTKKSPLETEVSSSRSRKLTSEGTSLDVAVLSADTITRLDVSSHIRNVKGLRSNDNINNILTRDLVNGIIKITNKLLNRFNSTVALPVTTNKELTHFVFYF